MNRFRAYPAVACIGAVAITTSLIYAQVRRPSFTDVANWMVEVDDNPRGRTPCAGIWLVAGEILSASHCLSAAPFVSSRSRERFVPAVVKAEAARHDAVLLQLRQGERSSQGGAQLAPHIPGPVLRFLPMWVSTRSRLLMARMIDANEAFISVVVHTTDVEEEAAALCFGDSGSPLLVGWSSTSLRVIGVLSNGDPRCTDGGINRFARVDLSTAWHNHVF